ncbi:hypothetical protein ACS94_00170 [Bacillus cereus]|nr:hypothetical protein ACS94_00170 [Bacillus cereus]
MPLELVSHHLDVSRLAHPHGPAFPAQFFVAQVAAGDARVDGFHQGVVVAAEDFIEQVIEVGTWPCLVQHGDHAAAFVAKLGLVVDAVPVAQEAFERKNLFALHAVVAPCHRLQVVQRGLGWRHGEAGRR